CRGLPLLESIRADLQLSLRLLSRSRVFTLLAIVMLALGIGINAAVFTVIKAALFDGFASVHRSDRIVQITTSKGAIYYPDFEEWRAQARSFDGMALVRGIFRTLSDEVDAPDTYYTMEVTPGTFTMLGVQPIIGRDFFASDQEPGAEPVVILRYELWSRRFRGN